MKKELVTFDFNSKHLRRIGKYHSRKISAMVSKICARASDARSQAMEKWLAHWYGKLFTPEEFARCQVEPGYCRKLGEERGIILVCYQYPIDRVELRVKDVVVARFVWDATKGLAPESLIAETECPVCVPWFTGGTLPVLKALDNSFLLISFYADGAFIKRISSAGCCTSYLGSIEKLGDTVTFLGGENLVCDHARRLPTEAMIRNPVSLCEKHLRVVLNALDAVFSKITKPTYFACKIIGEEIVYGFKENP